jgi:phasin family protein
MADLSAKNMEAFVGSAKLAGRTVEDLTRELSEYGRKTFDDAFAMARSFAEVKSPADLIRVQSQFAKAAFENAMAFSTHVSGTLTKVAGEVAGRAESSSSAEASDRDER